jgi:hypothetical protein
MLFDTYLYPLSGDEHARDQHKGLANSELTFSWWMLFASWPHLAMVIHILYQLVVVDGNSAPAL